MSFNLKDEEQIYLNELKSMKKTVEPLLKPEENEYSKNVLKEVLDYFDLICAYHDVQILPDLCASQDEQDVVNCFIKHKELFYLYEDIFRYEPYVIAYSSKHSRLLESIISSFKRMSNHLEKYVTFLNKLKLNNQIKEAIDTVKTALENHVDLQNIRFVIADLIVTEEVYLKELETLITDVYPLANNTKYRLDIKQISGNSDQIFKNQKLFYEDLLSCVYDSDVTEIMDCFLKHKQHFLLYSEDIALKSNSNLINSFTKDCRVPTAIDMTVTKKRLLYYTNSLEKAKKKCEGKAAVKIENVEKIMKDILTTANDKMQDIVEANRLNVAQTENSYEGHIITTKLGCKYQEKQKILQVYFQEKLVTKYKYNLMSDNEENLLQMKNAIERLLWAQVSEAANMIRNP